MGFEDRDYMRPQRVRVRRVGFPASGFSGSVVTILIIINIAIFVLCNMSSDRGRIETSPIFRIGALSTPLVLHGQIWRLITANYLHWSFGHILMNMLGLHFLGRPLERDWGRTKFLVVYSISGLVGSIFYLGFSYSGWLSLWGVAAGASGCVLGLLGACAVMYPRAELLIYFLFPIKIRTAALLFGGWYVINLWNGGPNAGGDACHLGGMAFGAWWAWKGEGWWSRRPGLKSGFPGLRRQRKPESIKYEDNPARDRADDEIIDRILRKVYDGGIHSLSESEKRTLQEATERRRKREARFGSSGII